MTWLDFRYKKKTQIPSKTSKINLTRTTRAGTFGLKLHQVALLHSSCRSHMASDHDGPKRKVVDLAMEKNSLVDHFFIGGHHRCRNRPRKSVNNVQIPVFGAHRVQSFCLARNLPGSFARNFRGRLMHHIVLALTFAYELRFRRSLYQNGLF